MRIEADQWRCNACGAVVKNVPADADPYVELRQVLGRPSLRLVSVNGLVVHRCTVPPGYGLPNR
jgi:hypothetical protein